MTTLLLNTSTAAPLETPDTSLAIRGSSSGEGQLNEQSYLQLVIVNAVLGIWLIYALYFNSRVFGFIISAIISRTTKMDFDLGSFSLSVLSGKIMFRGLYLATTDFSISIYDGIITFRWWKMFDLEYYQEKAPRLVMDLTTVDIHVYNRVQFYEELAQSFTNTKAKQISVIMDKRRQQPVESSVTSDRRGLKNPAHGPSVSGKAPPQSHSSSRQRRRNTGAPSSRSSGSDGGGYHKIESHLGEMVTSGSVVDDKGSMASKTVGTALDVERGSHGPESGSNTASVKDAPEPAAVRVWNAFKDLLAIIQVKACPVRIIFGNEHLDFSLVVFSKDCDIRYASQTVSHDSSNTGAGGSPQHSTANGIEDSNILVASSHKVQITMRNETKLSMVPKQSLYEPEANKATAPNTIGNFKTYLNPEKPPETCILVQSNERVEIGMKWDMPYRMPLSANTSFSELQEADTNSNPLPIPLRTVDISFTGHSRLSYSPYIDKKRAQLQKYFFPMTYDLKIPTTEPQPGGLRSPLELSVCVKFADSLVDFKFNDKEATQTADMQVFKMKTDAMFVKYKMPLTIGPTGYKNTCHIQLKQCRINSNISEFPSFIRGDTIEVRLEADIPLFWNYPQHWRFDISGRRISVFYLSILKQSLASIINDFGSKDKPDLLKFIPVRYKCNVDFEKVEAVFPVHQSNWVTNARSHSKNKKSHGNKENQAGPDINEDLLNSNAFKFINAQKITGTMDFNFLDFLPALLNNKFSFEASNLDVALHLPDSFPSKHILRSLAMSMKELTGFDSRFKTAGFGAGIDAELSSGDGAGGLLSSSANNRMFERFYTFPSSDAIEFIQCGHLSVAIDHRYHPVYYTENGNVSGYNLSLPKRTPKFNTRKLKTFDQTSVSSNPLDPLAANQPRFMSQIEPDVLEICVTFDQLVGIGYGVALKHLHAFIMNIFADVPLKQFERKSNDKQGNHKKRGNNSSPNNNAVVGNQQTGVAMDDSQQCAQTKHGNDQNLKFYASNRPMNVSVSIPITNVCVYIPEYLRINEACPVIRTDLILLEISSSFKEFRFQLIAAPITVVLPKSETNFETMPQSINDGTQGYRKTSSRTPTRGQRNGLRLQESVKCNSERNRITLAGLQLRLQGFSNVLETKDKSVSIEYAWLTEVKLLPLRGKVTISQLLDLANVVQGMVFLMTDPSCQLQTGPLEMGYCMHCQKRNDCTHKQTSENAANTPKDLQITSKQGPSVTINIPDKVDSGATKEDNLCVSSEDLKYRMVRIHVDSIDFNILEPDLISNINIYPVKVCWCNLHTPDSALGGTLHVERVSVRHFVTSCGLRFPSGQKTWVESGGIKFGPVFTDVSKAVTNSQKTRQQGEFLTKVDQSRKLFFLQSRSGDSNVYRKFPIGKCGCRGNCAFFGTTLLETVYYEALSIYDMREKAPNIADDFTGEIGGTVGVPLHHKNRKYRFPVFQAADHPFALLKHEGVVNRVTASSKENFRSCSPSIDFEAEKTLTELNKSELSSSISTTVTGSPQSVIRHKTPSASSISSDHQQSFTFVEQHYYDSNFAHSSLPAQIGKISTPTFSSEANVYNTVPKTESGSTRASSSSSKKIGQSPPNAVSSSLDSNAPGAQSQKASTSTNSSKSALSHQKRRTSAGNVELSKRSSYNSDPSEKQTSDGLFKINDERDDDQSSLTESFKSALSDITGEGISGNWQQVDVTAADKRDHFPSERLADTQATYGIGSTVQNTLVGHLDPLDIGGGLIGGQNEFTRSTASATSESSANHNENEKLLAYYQFLLPQVEMDFKEAEDEIDNSFLVSSPFSPLAETVVHVDSDGHIKSRIVEPGLDMNMINPRDPLDYKISASNQNQPGMFFNTTRQSTQSTTGGLGKHPGQRVSTVVRSSSQRRTAPCYTTKPGEEHTEVMVNFEEPICALFSPLMIGAVCRYLDCCSSYIKSSHPGNVLFQIHQSSVSAAVKHLSSEDLDDMILEVEKTHNRKPSRGTKLNSAEGLGNKAGIVTGGMDIDATDGSPDTLVEPVPDPIAHSFTFSLNISEINFNVLQALVDDTVLPNASQISGASLLSMRLINFDANFLSKKEQVLSPEGNIADNVEISVKSSLSQVEAQMQQLKSAELTGKDEYITNIAQDMSQCSFAVVNPKSNTNPGWIMTEGGFNSINLSGVKLVGYHDPAKRKSKRSNSVSEEFNQQNQFHGSGSHQGPIKDEPTVLKYSDTSKASAVIDLIWFNVASPENRNAASTHGLSARDTLVNEPQPQLTLDYNLLTTGTFTIAAWLKQFDELKDAIKSMNAENKMRIASVLSSVLYLFIFAPDRPDYDIKAPSCDFENHLTPLAKKLRHDLSMRTLMKLFQKLPSADVVVLDYTLQRNLLPLDTLYHALYTLCEIIAKNNRNTNLPGKQNSKPKSTTANAANVNEKNKGSKIDSTGKSGRSRGSILVPHVEETRIDIDDANDLESSQGQDSKLYSPTGADFSVGGQRLPAIGEIGEDVTSQAEDESENEDTIDNEEDHAMMTLENFDIEREKPVKSEEAVQRWLMNSERGAGNARSSARARLTGGIRQSVLPDGVEVNETSPNLRADTFKFSDTVSPNENRNTMSVLSRRSSEDVSLNAASDEGNVGASRREWKRGAHEGRQSEQKSEDKEAFNSFKALLHAVKAYKDNAEQYEFTKIFGREVFVCGKILSFRIDVVSKTDKSGHAFSSKSYRKQKKNQERDPIFCTQNFEVNFSLKEQQSTLRKSTLTRLKNRSQRNSLFIDCLITLAKTTYKLDFSVVKLINQIYCSVQKIHEELGWNRVLKDHEINTKAFGTKPSFDNGSHNRSSIISERTEDDEGDDCWIFIYKKSQLADENDAQWFPEDFNGRSFDDAKDDSPGRIVTHVIASWLAAEFCTEIGGLITRTYFDTFNVSYWGRQSRVGRKSKETDRNITANMKQLDITVTEADHCGASIAATYNQSIMTFIVKNTGLVISSKEKMDKQKRSYIWFNIRDVSLNIPLQPSALRQTVDKTSKRITELKSKLAPMPQTGQAASGISPKEPHASQRSGLNSSVGGSPGDHQDGIRAHFGDANENEETTDVPIDNLKCDSSRETHFKARLDQLEIKTALLVDFTAAYQMTNLRAFGKNSRNIGFEVILDNHFLQFQSGAEPANLRFPNISLEGIYVPIVKPNNTGGFVKIQQSHRSYEGGNFLILVVNVAKLEEHLSSDLLNHFVIVQKVFRSEVKEVISKVSENSAPNGWNIVQSTAGKPPESTLRSFGSERGSNPRPADEIFGDSPPFMLQAKFVMDTLRVTATTPTNNAVQLVLDAMEFEVSNFPNGDCFMKRNKKLMKMLARGKMTVDASLGTIKHSFAKSTYDSLPNVPSSHQDDDDDRNSLEKKAFVTFSVDFENSAKDANDEENSQAVQVTVSKFKLYLEPEAIEHTFKIYINYKNAFEYFTAERQKRNVNGVYNAYNIRDDAVFSPGRDDRQQGSPTKKKKTSSDQGVENTNVQSESTGEPQQRPGSIISSAESTSSRLYFLFVIQDLAVCVPLEAGGRFGPWKDDLEQVLMLTIKRTSVSTVSNNSLFCVGTFKTFTLGFREDFDTKSSNWMIDRIEDSFAPPQKTAKTYTYPSHFASASSQVSPANYIMNTFWVPEGSVDVVSRTKTLASHSAGAVWELSIRWQMKGLHVRFDTKLGKWLVMLKNTLTRISEDLTEEESDNEDEADSADTMRGDDRKKYQEQQMVVMKLKGDKSKVNTTRIAAEEYTLKHMEDRQARQQIKNLKRRTSMAASGAPGGAMGTAGVQDLTQKQRKSMQGLGQASTVSGPGNPLVLTPFPTFSYAGIGSLAPIAGSPTGSVGNTGLGSQTNNAGSHTRTQSMALGGFNHDLSPVGGSEMPYSMSHHTVTGSNQTLEPLRASNFPGSVPNTNKWSDDEEESNLHRNTPLYPQQNQVGHHFPARPVSINVISSDYVNTHHLTTSENSHSAHSSSTTRPSTLFLRSNQHAAESASKGIGMKFDLGISISSGECVLHADPPSLADSKLASPVKGSRRTEPNVSHITLPAVSVKTYYSGETTTIEAEVEEKAKEERTTPSEEKKTDSIPTDFGRSSATSSNRDKPSLLGTRGVAYKQTHSSPVETFSPVFGNRMGSALSSGGTTSSEYITAKSTTSIPRINLPKEAEKSDRVSVSVGVKKEATGSLRSNRSLNAMTHRHGRLCLYVVIQRLEDPLMRLSPCFLDYIQQTLNNVSEDDPDSYMNTSHISSRTVEEPGTPQSGTGVDSTKVIVTSDTKFPVDVVIALTIEPFEIDIDCYPHDKIACMMLLPKTNVVFSSVRDNLSAIEPSGGPESSTESKRSTSSTKGKSEEPKRKVSTCHDQMSPKFCSQTQIGEANGWIVTVVADDFNVYVFHQFKLNNDDPRNMGGVGASSFGYNFGDNSRKDAFSLSVKSVKLNICRNATLHMTNTRETIGSSKNMASATSQGAARDSYPRLGRTTSSTSSSQNTANLSSCERYRYINMSIILDFGECQFKFDIRKLQDLRTFLKYWYRQKLIKQAFIAPDPEIDPSDLNLNDIDDIVNQGGNRNAVDSDDVEFEDGTRILRDSSQNRRSGNYNATASPELRRRKKASPNDEIPDRPWSPKTSTLASGSRSNTKWESNVNVAANFSSFEVNMQLDSFMGSIKIKTEKLLGTGLLHLTSDRHKFASSKITLGKSELTSIAATINPSFHLRNWSLQFSMKRPPQEHPEHKISLSLNESEFRMNYKSNPILMGCFNMLKLNFSDTWRIEAKPTSQIPCKLLINSDISWDNAQILMVQSTIPDFIIIKTRFIHFYNSYFNTKSVNSPMTGNKASGSMTGSVYQGLGALRVSEDSIQGTQKKVNWRRHWPGIVSDIVSGNFPFLPSNLSSNKVLLSGKVELKGDELSVVLMENEIRSSRWFVLALYQPLVSFSTECQQIVERDLEMLIVEQNLSAQLLHDTLSKADRKRDMQMAEIKLYHRIGDGSCPIMVASAVKEWFAHTLKNTTANSQEVGVRSYYKVESSLIGSLPRIQASLTTEQKQTLIEPRVAESTTNRRSSNVPSSKPRVDCRFSTTFHQPIQIAVDPQYIEIFKKLFKEVSEKVKAASASSKTGGATNVPLKVSKLDDPREFDVIHWLFDPSVNFLTRHTSSTDPPGINWVWKKLGIENCKHSLPKFSQRYLMDQLDAAVARAVLYDIRKLSKLHHQLPDVVQK